MKTLKITHLLVFCLATTICQAQVSDKISIKKFDLKYSKVQEFDKIAWESGYTTYEEGKPELPFYRVSYVLPINAVVSGVSFRVKEKQTLKENIYILPAQAPISSNNINPFDFTLPDTKVYASDIPYPNKLYEIVSDDFFHGYHIVTIHIYPFEYIPKSRIMNYYPDLEYTIEYTESKNSKTVRPIKQSVVRADLCKKIIKNIVKNSNDVDIFGSNVQSLINGRMVIPTKTSSLRSDDLSILDEICPDYIIITCDSLKSVFQPFADWKIKKGLFTIIVTTEHIQANYTGSDMAEKIRKYLIEAYAKWGPDLYVLLGGDINIVPSRMVAGKYFSGENNHLLKYPTDMYYSSYYSNIWGPRDSIPPTTSLQNNLKVILGRIPISNAQEVNSYIGKVITYEKAYNLENLNYFKNNLYSDAYMQGSGNQLYDFCLSSIKLYNNNYVPSHIYRKYICDRASSNGGDIELNKNNFLDALNYGADLGVGKFHFIYHMDHGSPMSIGISNKDKGENVNRTDMNSLENGKSYQILMSSSCHPANFQYDCIGKHYLINHNGGGVAFIGNTDSGTTGEHTQMRDFCDALYTTTGHPSIGRYDIGSAFQNIHLKGTHGEKWQQKKSHSLINYRKLGNGC
ncbi:hypothetical protein FACS189413_18200 [Bacteroidia bacterium]|nr:hypothetical protein FACS189413_18200 [Bacteroidia bacterium]